MIFSAEIAVVKDGDLLVLSLSEPFPTQEAAEDAAVKLVENLDVPADNAYLQVLGPSDDEIEIVSLH